MVQESIGVTTNMAATAMPPTIAAMPLTGTALLSTPGTIHSSDVPMSAQTTLSLTGSSSMPLIRMPPTTQAAIPPMPLINMLHAAMQPTAMPLTATPSIMLVMPNQLGYFTCAPSAFNFQGTQFPTAYMPKCGWQVSQREQMLAAPS